LPDSSKASSGSLPDRRPIFYYITDRKHLTGHTLVQNIRRAIFCGVDFIQIREKDLSDRELFELACKAVLLSRKGQSKIIVNGRADIALAAGAHGVHLPASAPKISDLKSWLPASFLIGASTHSAREARRAFAEGADYVLFGPVFYTESKAAYGPPLGLNRLRRTCSALNKPVLGLGGIRAESIGPVLKAGAAGIAAISMFQDDVEFAAFRKTRLTFNVKRVTRNAVSNLLVFLVSFFLVGGLRQL
jgi:thiamine-phosphate pyrophosphorylase